MLYGVSMPTAQTNYSHVERDSSQGGYCQVLALCLSCFLTCQLRAVPVSRFTVKTTCSELHRARRFLSTKVQRLKGSRISVP